ncbi:fatty acid desaturase family protein [Aestuariimicrobium ganziense]|uniref:fatty acid desaturase family protein n=1 Tax=Aestuariimicrobium ganziense TaxID=2773677 RepID=UPI001943D4B7|nr:acyl-CoA desaturase [Aestuariimicrobium ganziense]
MTQTLATTEQTTTDGSTPTTWQGHALTDAVTTAKLTHEQVEQIGARLDEIRAEVIATRGESDARYIRGVIRAQRWLEASSRVVLLFSKNKVAFVVGTAGLSVAKILENMEIGHNVLHGQWDWMRDPKIHSTTWEWDAVTPAEQWKHSHNETHHTYTNVVGRDNDLGYGIMRVDNAQPWSLKLLGQPFFNLVNATFFEYGIAAYDLELFDNLKKGEDRTPEQRETFRRNAAAVGRKLARQMGKDYLVHPLLSGPNALHTAAANAIANVVRNLWTHSVIICGHFPDGVEVFEKTSIEGETKAQWYLRQMLGSANITGSKFMHLMSGNLSHQIEHHLFPDLPSNRYAEIAPKVKALFEEYGLRYVSGPLPVQVAQAWGKVFRLSLPDREPGRSRWSIIGEAVGQALRGRPTERVAVAAS